MRHTCGRLLLNLDYTHLPISFERFRCGLNRKKPKLERKGQLLLVALSKRKERKIRPVKGGSIMNHLPCKLWRDDKGQDIAEYAVMLAVILVLVVGTVRLVGSNANNAFSSVASSLQ